MIEGGRKEGRGQGWAIERQLISSIILTIVRFGAFSKVKVSPEAQSIPNSAQISLA